MDREKAVKLFAKLNRGAPDGIVTDRMVEDFANAVARVAEAAERERCFQLLRAILAQVEDLDDIDPQPDISCIDWLRTALAKIVGPNVKVNRPVVVCRHLG